MSTRKHDPELSQLLTDVESYLLRYVTFTTPDYAFAGALWAAATYLWPHFDAFPYLHITAATKRAGKSRLMELLSFVSSNPRTIAGMTPATVFRLIRDENPTLFMDEAESLSSEAAGMMRSILNVGYRKGAVIPRMGKTGVEEWPAYCPKSFISIGDVADTLRDRSIVVIMQRGEAPSRFLYEPARLDGNDLGARLKTALEANQDAILAHYTGDAALDFLPDRDEEIWLPLFAVCAILAPHRVIDLKRVAVDMATEKTVSARRHSGVDVMNSERDAEEEEYARRLVRDLLTVMDGRRHIFSTDALPKLYELPTGPWRKFRGEGLTAIDMSNMLSRFDVKPKNIRADGGRKAAVRRGYTRESVIEAMKKHGLTR
jgi:hypothetical protein